MPETFLSAEVLQGLGEMREEMEAARALEKRRRRQQRLFREWLKSREGERMPAERKKRKRLEVEELEVFGVQKGMDIGKGSDWTREFIQTLCVAMLFKSLGKVHFSEKGVIEEIEGSPWFVVSEVVKCESKESWKKVRKTIATNANVKEKSKKKMWPLLKKWLESQRD